MLLNIKLNKFYLKLFCSYRLQQFNKNEFILELSQHLDSIDNNVIRVGDANIIRLTFDAITNSNNTIVSNNGFT